MKKIFSLMLIAVAVAGIVSCQKSEIEEQVAAEEQVTTEAASYLFATIEGEPKSRVSMTDNGIDGLSFAWESTDFLTVEVGDVTYTYTCSDAEKGLFGCDQVPDFVEGTKYRVVFGEDFYPTHVQDNSDNSFGGSDETFGLIANFTYTEGEPIWLQFTGNLPIITIICRNFDAERYKPEVLFNNGTYGYVSYISENCVVDDQGTFYATIVLSPDGDTERELTFKFEGKEDKNDILTYYTHIEKDFDRGVRYMADITDLFHYEADCYTCTVEDVKDESYYATAPSGAVLMIVDEVFEYGALQDMVINEGVPVDVILPNATTFETGWPNNSSTFYNATGIKSIYAPKLTTIGTTAFRGSSITSFEAPLLELDATHRETFAYCSSLTSVKVKSMSVIADDLFSSCESLTDIDLSEVTEVSTGYSGGGLFGVGLTNISLPKAKSLGDQAISWCPNLESVELPVATSFGSYCFRYCEKLRTLKLTAPELIEYNTNAFKFITGDARVEPACHLYLSAVNYANVTNGNEWGGATWAGITLVE